MTVAPSPNPRFAREARAEYIRAKFAPTYPTIPRNLDGDFPAGKPVVVMSMAALVLAIAVSYGGYNYYFLPRTLTTQSASGKIDLPQRAIFEVADGKGDLPATSSRAAP